MRQPLRPGAAKTGSTAMERYFTIILFTAAAFLAVVTSLAAKRKYAARLTGTALTLAGIGGLLLYSYGCAQNTEHLPLAILWALFNTCDMFLGGSDYDLLKNTPLCADEAGQFLFWIIHFLALYATAGAVIITVGTKILKQIRMALFRRHDLILVYGVDDSTVPFGCSLMEKNHHVIFVDDSESNGLGNRIITAGSILLSDNSACQPDVHFLKSIGMARGKRRLTIYALQHDSAKNADYALAMMNALQKRGISPAQTSLIISGVREEDGSWLLNTPNHYGYGNVFAFGKSQLAARLLIQKYPPCNTLTFSPEGLAREDFNALIIGFGQCGQAVLHQLVANGQFAGSTFHLAVFSPDCHQVDGLLYSACPAVLEHYSIDFYEADARSRTMYDYLAGHADTLKYVVVAVGGDKLRREIRCELQKELTRLRSAARIYECSQHGVVYSSAVGHPIGKHSLLSAESLDPEKLDRTAAALNQRYCAASGGFARENWANCSYFNRLSSRASADFAPAILRAAGKSAEEAVENWQLTPVQKVSLGQTEHLRWCAFHYMMGYRPMPEAIYRARAEQYRQAAAQGLPVPRKIGKDPEQKLHACLVPWEQLDGLSAFESELTGKPVDYKQMDIANVELLPELLRLSAEQEG